MHKWLFRFQRANPYSNIVRVRQTSSGQITPRYSQLNQCYISFFSYSSNSILFSYVVEHQLTMCVSSHALLGLFRSTLPLSEIGLNILIMQWKQLTRYVRQLLFFLFSSNCDHDRFPWTLLIFNRFCLKYVCDVLPISAVSITDICLCRNVEKNKKNPWKDPFYLHLLPFTYIYRIQTSKTKTVTLQCKLAFNN